ncbi:MAG: bifunctional aspartate kinase/homoserine dehydrogenase I [Bacteroidota bacterium]
MIIIKFGGTSVGDPKRIQGVFDIATNLLKKTGRRKLGVVVSAMTGVTDDLIKMSKLAAQRDPAYAEVFNRVRHRHHTAVTELGLIRDKQLNDFLEQRFAQLHDTLHGVYLVGEFSARTLDFVSAHGELLSARIIASYFKHRKVKAGFLDAREVVRTDEEFGSAKVDFNHTNKAIRNYFKKTKNDLEIITGFVAATSHKETTTLGRGGSDYSAAIFGAALGADEIQIWTDVDGVLTADPRKVRKAFTVPQMTYREAMEMSHFGAKVIHPPTILPALAKGIPLRIKNSFRPQHPGTFISTKSVDSGFLIKGISSIDDVTLITMEGSGMVGVTGISARVFGALSTARINVILITQGSSEHTITFAVKPSDAQPARKAIENAFALEIKSKLIEPVKVEEGLSVLAVIGEDMKNTPGVSGRLFQALGKNGISIVATAQGSSELNISTVIHKIDLVKSLNAIHQAFFLSGTQSLSVFLVGVTGLIGKTLLKQIDSHREYLKTDHALEINIVGLANSKKMYFNADGISLRRANELLEQEGERVDHARFAERMVAMNLPHAVFVDCSSSEEVVSAYSNILDHSISIVTPNKLANSASYKQYDMLHRIARHRNVRFLYETNVGAGLPVINTLNSLTASGDRIISIEAVLSGTLSFIFNTFREGMRFSDIVKEARERGYTEPDPRVDLSGKDVARKLLILARETGLQLEMKDIKIDQILPPKCLRAKTVNDFMRELRNADNHFQSMLAKAERRGHRLRFIARLENGKASVVLKEVDDSHPFYHLSGSDNIISFRTDRYDERPLVVKGPGAGAEVTAAGVFADIISIGNYFDRG